MAARDRISEIIEVKRRGPHNTFAVEAEIRKLSRKCTQLEQRDSSSDDFAIIRSVTLLEVLSRRWVARLIDFGSPYVERLSELKLDIKFDATMVYAVHGRAITLGDFPPCQHS